VTQTDRHIAIVGAGIIGICCAHELRSRGFVVTLIDRDEPCTGTSWGNAGAIAVAETLPLASPGIMAKAPRWLLDPTGPLSVPPSYLPTMLPWLYRFWRASSAAQVRRSAEAISSLLGMSVEALTRITDAAGISHKLRPMGDIHVYQGRRQFDSSRWGWDMRRELGVKFDVVSGTDVRSLEPALDASFTHAVHIPDWLVVTDPFEIGHDIATDAIARGVKFRSGSVRAIGSEGGKPLVQMDRGEDVAADYVVLAAGAWSHRLTRDWGEHFPLETERGYNTTFATPNIQLKQQVTFAEHGFVVSPLTCGMRIGGAVEFAGLDAPPNYARSKAMVKKAQRFFPEFDPASDTVGGVEWMGFRPSLPDSLPVISRSSVRSDVFCAFGHGHMGLTESGSTAQLIADLITERRPAIDMDPFRAGRF
jgi:D-amino-acid dehydrogenase